MQRIYTFQSRWDQEKKTCSTWINSAFSIYSTYINGYKYVEKKGDNNENIYIQLKIVIYEPALPFSEFIFNS